MSETVPFFDQALEAAERLDARCQQGSLPSRDDCDLVVRALREIVALNRGVMAENRSLKERLRVLEGSA